jgi:hypothetical protein
MIKKACTIGALAVGLTFSALHGMPVCGKLVSSAQNFQQCFRSLKKATVTTNPVERVMLSLILANAKTTSTAR